MDERPSGSAAPPGTRVTGGLLRRRGVRVAGAVTLGIVAVTVFVLWSWAAYRASVVPESRGPGGPSSEASTAAGAADEATGTPGSASASESPAAPGGGDGAASGPGSPSRQPIPLVAYRRDGWLCVAREDGTGERRLVSTASGPFALSPDGATLAYVDRVARELVLVDVATGTQARMGAAEPDRPAWAPDSSWLVYTAPGPQVRRVGKDGSRPSQLFGGAVPAISTDGALVVGASARGDAAGIVVWRAGATTWVPTAAEASGLASDGRRIFYGLPGGDAKPASLRVVASDGTGDRALVVRPHSERAVAICELLLTRDARALAYSECGDDGYSRLFVLPTTGGEPVALSLRRDCYPLEWTLADDGLLFIEGNAFQGEATALAFARRDGTGRVRLVEGAGR